MELLCCGDLQGVIVLTLDGDVLVGEDGFRVSVPVDGVFRRTFHSAGEEECAANSRFQVLGR